MALKKPGKAMIPWEKEMADAAKAQSVAPKSGGERTFISLKGGMMSLGDRQIKDGKLDVIILDFAYVNSYYSNPYNPKAPESPGCFALSRDKEGMAPHADADDPQNKLCGTCPNNEFGSRGDGGMGKACKNNIRLTVMAAGDLGKDISKASIAYLMVPPTSVKAFGNFYKEECCDEEGDPVKPTYSFVSTVSVRPDPKTQIKVEFDLTGAKVTREQFYALRDRIKALGDDVMFAFPKREAAAAKPATARRRKM